MSNYRITIELTDMTENGVQSLMAGIHDVIDAEGIDMTSENPQVLSIGFELIDDEAEEVDLDAIDGEHPYDDDAARYMEKATSITELVMKAESEGLDTEEEFHAYIWLLVDSGLVNSTGSNQRLVNDFANGHGEAWKMIVREAFKSYFNGATTVAEVGL